MNESYGYRARVVLFYWAEKDTLPLVCRQAFRGRRHHSALQNDALEILQ